MAIEGYPFSTSQIADELQWSRLFRALQIDGVIADAPDTNSLKVSVTGSTISVDLGEAFINGFFGRVHTAAETKTVTLNSGGSTRVDRVVLRASQTANAVTVEYVTGGTSAPALQQNRNDVFDIPLARFSVAAGSGVIQSGTLVDERIYAGKPVAASNSGARRSPTRNQILIEGTATAPVVLVGTGSGWVQVYPPPAPTWNTPTLASGWTNYGSIYHQARYVKTLDSSVFLQGLVKTTSARPALSTIFTLPAGFRPSQALIFPTTASIGMAGPQRVDIQADGRVQCYQDADAGMFVSLSGITFIPGA